MEQFDVVIVGAGMAGASLAWALAPRRRVLVLERESQPGYHSTGRSAATLHSSYGNRTIRALTAASAPFYRDPPPGFAEAPLARPCAVLKVARAGPADGTGAGAGTDTLVRAAGAAPRCGRLPGAGPGPARRLCRRRRARPDHARSRRRGHSRRLPARRTRPRRGRPHLGADRRRRAGVAATGGSRPAMARSAARSWSTPPVPGPTRSQGWPGSQPLGIVPHRRTAILVEAPKDGQSGHWPMLEAVGESLVRQARRRPAPVLAGGRDPRAPVRRPARGARRRDLRGADRGGVRVPDPPHREPLGRPALLRRRPDTGRRLRPSRRGLRLAGRPGRLRHPDGTGAGGAGRCRDPGRSPARTGGRRRHRSAQPWPQLASSDVGG